MVWGIERNYAYADQLAHRTADEVVEVLRTWHNRDMIARCVAENTAEDAMTILDIGPEVYEVIVEYVKPRWPELF